jgi:hypothetical protein
MMELRYVSGEDGRWMELVQDLFEWLTLRVPTLKLWVLLPWHLRVSAVSANICTYVTTKITFM